MKALPPELQEKYRNLLGFMLSPEFSGLSTENGGDYEEPVKPKKKPAATKAKSGSYPKDCFWFISTPEGTLLVEVHAFKGSKGNCAGKPIAPICQALPRSTLRSTIFSAARTLCSGRNSARITGGRRFVVAQISRGRLGR